MSGVAVMLCSEAGSDLKRLNSLFLVRKLTRKTAYCSLAEDLTMYMKIILIALMSAAFSATNAGYEPGEDSMPNQAVPKGKVEKHVLNNSRIYPGTTHEYQVYIPAQYRQDEPAAVMVFQDGDAYVHPEGQVRAPTVFDNLIHRDEMPVTIGIFVNPGTKEKNNQRDVEYLPLDDTYARFLLEEILPAVGSNYNLTEDAAGRAICGMSDGGLAAFTVAWERPGSFSKVISHIGSYGRLSGAEYPYRLRLTRGDPKPIRVFLQDGSNDLNLRQGNWTLGNLAMESALMYARYDYRFEMGTGGHDLAHAGAIFPDTLRWIWRDYPGVRQAAETSRHFMIIGEWHVVTNILGTEYNAVLNIGERNGELHATLVDETDGEIDLRSITFEDRILRYAYARPPSQLNWQKHSTVEVETWLKVHNDSLKGALSGGIDSEIDFSVTGRRTAGPIRSQE